jgi:hypothetical protein
MDFCSLIQPHLLLTIMRTGEESEILCYTWSTYLHKRRMKLDMHAVNC